MIRQKRRTVLAGIIGTIVGVILIGTVWLSVHLVGGEKQEDPGFAPTCGNTCIQLQNKLEDGVCTRSVHDCQTTSKQIFEVVLRIRTAMERSSVYDINAEAVAALWYWNAFDDKCGWSWSHHVKVGDEYNTCREVADTAINETWNMLDALRIE